MVIRARLDQPELDLALAALDLLDTHADRVAEPECPSPTPADKAPREVFDHVAKESTEPGRPPACVDLEAEGIDQTRISIS
jgi:hypothetical protein